MQILHILRSHPNEDVLALMKSFSEMDGKTVALFEGDIDWDTLVDEIFASEKVISWW
ncbi:MAG: hypothetical protein V1793_05780 [Pseudomonadota bacterium]